MTKKFAGAALYPVRLSGDKTLPVWVLVWLPWCISQLQASRLIDSRDQVRPGEGRIITRRFRSRTKRGTYVAYFGPIPNSKEARSAVMQVVKLVENETGAHPLLQPTPTQNMVREAFFAYR